MARRLRVVSVQRGYDPAAFKLVAFGGAGPLHALAIAAETGIRDRARAAPSGHRLGLAACLSPISSTISRATLVERIERADPGALEEALKLLAEQGRKPLQREGVPHGEMRFERALDMRYVGQSYHLTIPLGPGPASRPMLEEARGRFNEAHFAAYGYAEPSEPCELVNVRVSAMGAIRRAELREGASGREEAQKGARSVWFEATGFMDARSTVAPRWPTTRSSTAQPCWKTETRRRSSIPAGAATASPAARCASSGRLISSAATAALRHS